jgi:hypothetical protein
LERGIPNVQVTLSGTENRVVRTNDQGEFSFGQLRGGEYFVTQTQPLAFIDGLETVGTLGAATGNDVFRVSLARGAMATGLLFGERGLQARAIAPDTFFARPGGPTNEIVFPANAAGEATFVTLRPDGSGELTLAAEGEATLELFDDQLNPVARSVNGVLSADVVAGRGYVLFVASVGGPTRLQSTSQHSLMPVAIPLHNRMANTDVDFDGWTAPLDALLVINRLNGASGSTSRLNFMDVNADGFISPIDALVVINQLNLARPSNAAGEGEGAAIEGPAIERAEYGDESLATRYALAASDRTTAATSFRTVSAASLDGERRGNAEGRSAGEDPSSTRSIEGAAFPWDAEEFAWETLLASPVDTSNSGDSAAEDLGDLDSDPYAASVDSLFGNL